MNQKLLYVAITAVSLLWSTVTLAQSKTEKEVANAVEQLKRMMIDPDSAALDRLTFDELSYGHSSGHVEDKKTFMHALLSGESDFVTIDITDQTIKVVNNTAIVRHILTATTNDRGKPGTVKLAVLTVWQKDKRGWKLLARQAVHV